MTTRLVTTDSSNYTEVSTQPCLVYNKSSYNIRMVFSNSAPSTEDTTYFILKPNKAVVKNEGFPTGNLYALTDKTNEGGLLSVSE